MASRIARTLSLGARSRFASSLATLAPAANRYDAVIIGAGVIGNSVAVELARHGWKTLSVDKLSGAGHGSTGYSSGICRMMYSIPDSVKFAWEGYAYYENWAEHIGVHDENGYAFLRECGGLVLRNESSKTYLSKVIA